MDLTVNLAPTYRDLKDPTTRQNFDDTVEQKRVIDLRACRIKVSAVHAFELTACHNTTVLVQLFKIDFVTERNFIIVFLHCRLPRSLLNLPSGFNTNLH